MSIQSTRYILRQEAENLLYEKRSNLSEIPSMSDLAIENELDETYFNYIIIGDRERKI